MKQLLESYGYKYTGNCACDGYSTNKYKNGEYQIRYRHKQQRFRIKKHGSYQTVWLPYSELQNKLDELHPATKESIAA